MFCELITSRPQIGEKEMLDPGQVESDPFHDLSSIQLCSQLILTTISAFTKKCSNRFVHLAFTLRIVVPVCTLILAI